MNKKLIRLTEQDLHRIIKESVNKILNEMYDDSIANRKRFELDRKTVPTTHKEKMAHILKYGKNPTLKYDDDNPLKNSTAMDYYNHNVEDHNGSWAMMALGKGDGKYDGAQQMAQKYNGTRKSIMPFANDEKLKVLQDMDNGVYPEIYRG